MNTITISQGNIQSLILPDITSKLNIKAIILSVFFIVLSIVMYYASNLLENNMLSSTLIFLGIVADCFAIFLLLKRLKSQVCTKTNSEVKKTCNFYGVDDYLPIKIALENNDYKAIKNVKTHEDGNIQLCYIYSKDYKYLAVQLFKYEPFEYKPQTDIYVMEGDTASTFIDAIKHW